MPFPSESLRCRLECSTTAKRAPRIAALGRAHNRSAEKLPTFGHATGSGERRDIRHCHELGREQRPLHCAACSRIAIRSSGEFTLAGDSYWESDHDGEPHQISFGVSGNCGRCCVLVKHQPDERFRPSLRHATSRRDRDREFERGNDLGFERRWLYRLLLRDTLIEREIECLCSAIRGAISRDRSTG